MFAGKKSAQIREILISESAWEEMTCLFAPSLAMDSGAKRILLPMASASDIPTVPAELFSKFQISFYADPVDAVFKALGVN